MNMHKAVERYACLGLTTASLVAASLWLASSARADYSIAYCDAENHAVNIYREGDPESPTSELKMRIYHRADGITFLNTLADRNPNPEGYNYSNIRGENEWTLFIPNNPDSPCTLSRDGEVFDQGTVTMREPPSTGN
jgi:hypothetical protein